MFEKCVLGRVTFKQSIFRFKLPNQIVWISVLAVQKKKIKKGRSMFDYTLKECMLSETECEFVKWNAQSNTRLRYTYQFEQSNSVCQLFGLQSNAMFTWKLIKLPGILCPRMNLILSEKNYPFQVLFHPGIPGLLKLSCLIWTHPSLVENQE